ncbi:MAG TPA: hypothetical protein VF103_18140, partial [Polyangiaceae bacterium]
MTDSVRTILELGRLARSRLDPAARFLFGSATLAAVVAAGYVARRGTLEMRSVAASIVVGVALSYLGRFWLWRRDLARRDRLVRRVVLDADRSAGERVLRALALDEHARNDPSIGSAELASLHLARVVGRIPTKRVEERSERWAVRYRLAGILLISAATVGLGAAPERVAEGLDVLVAHRGVAPLDMGWLDSLSVVSQPPAYLRTPDRRIDPGAAYFEPQGATIVVRGEPTRPDRRLVLTDGKKEIPFTEDAALGVVARWTLTADADLRIAARFGDVVIRDPQPIRLRSAPDLPPTVVLDGAPRTVPLQGLERLELRYRVGDDHGLREVDLVLRSGGQEERRVLEKLDGQAAGTQGAQAVDQNDAFLRRMFLPVTLTVEARDTNSLGAAVWGKSQAITITPPPVGDPEAARYRALAEVRGGVVDWLAWLIETDPKSPDYEKELARRRGQVVESLMTSGTYRGGPALEALRISAGIRAFFHGQAQRLTKPRPGVTARASAEDVAVAVDAVLRSLGRRDAESVAKRLGDVAEEAADGFKEARETERRDRGRTR